MNKIYLDNSATTALLPEAAALMVKTATEAYGNPSSLHGMGLEAEELLREAAAQAAAPLRVNPEELIWTSGGTESDNLALRGAADALKRRGKHIITSAIEHPAVLRTCGYLETLGFEVSYLPVSEEGQVLPETLAENIRPDTILVSIMHTNNEVGSLQPLRELGQVIRERNPEILFHVDAVQGYLKEEIRPAEEGIDLLSVSGHKFHAPKGTGFLYCRKGVRINPILFGGGQQKNLRSGTENVPGIAALGLAAGLQEKALKQERERLRELRSFFLRGLKEAFPAVIINGSADPEKQAAHIVSASFPGIRSEVLLHALEEEGIYASAGSACASNRKEKFSDTLRALRLSPAALESTLRFSFSRFTTKEELAYALEAVEKKTKLLKGFTRK